MEDKILKFFIRKNSETLREKLKCLGFYICTCCEFEGAEWLSANTFKISMQDKIYRGSVHGFGYWSEDAPFSYENRFDFYLKDNEKSNNPGIDCGDNEDLFIALASISDSECGLSDYYIVTENPEHSHYIKGELYRCLPLQSNIHPNCYRKATVEEIINHFNNVKS